MLRILVLYIIRGERERERDDSSMLHLSFILSFLFFIFDNDEKWFHLKVFYFSCGTSWVRVRSVWADFPKEYTLLFFYVAMLSCLVYLIKKYTSPLPFGLRLFFFFFNVRKKNNVIFVNIFYSSKKLEG